MYFQKDYVLRMIEMMGDLMRRLLQAAREADALEEIDEISQKACGMPLSMLREADTGTLETLLSEPQRYLAAELLMIDIEIASRKQMDDALLPRRTQAISIYATSKDPDYMLLAADRAEALLETVLGDLPADLLLRVALLMERADKFASAENALFMAMEEMPELRPEVCAFYNRIERLPDQALLAGGLSREEIAEGRAELGQ